MEYIKKWFNKLTLKNINEKYDISEPDISDASNFIDMLKPSISGNGDANFYGNINNSSLTININNYQSNEMEK